MSVDFNALAFCAYVLTILLALFAEFSPWRGLARGAARCAVALAVVAGGSWCYGVYKQGYVPSPFEKLQRGKKGGGPGVMLAGNGKGGNGALRSRKATGGAELQIEDDRTDEGDTGEGFSLAWARARDETADATAGLIQTLFARRTNWHGRQGDIDGDIKRDCAGCPEMVVIAGGAAFIGAAEGDDTALPAERPQRLTKVWPGFAISRKPISHEEFELFRAGAGGQSHVCAREAPSLAGASSNSARCITAAQAARFAEWLSVRTGLHFRIPTAIEWEFAARARGVTVLANAAADAAQAAPLEGIGRDLAEMTADCYDPYIPTPGRERRLWSASPLLCRELVLKGARLGEEALYQRFSARRPWPHEVPDAGVGFRVVRDLM